MEPRDKAVLSFALGVLLILNPVYLFPGGVPGEKTYTYEAERIETDHDFERAVHPSAVLDCSGTITSYDCVLLREVGYNETLRIDNDTAVHLRDDDRWFFDFEYVRFEDGYVRPTATIENGTLELSTEPQNQTQVREEFAREYDNLPPLGKRVIDNGSVSITKWIQFGEDVDPEIPEYKRFVEKNGTFYEIRRNPGEWWRPVPEWAITLARFVGVAGGIVLAFVGASRHARIVDAQDRDEWPRR